MARKSERTRQRIIEAANRLFYHRGYNQTSFSDVVEAAGVPRGNIYYYFKTKDEILEAAIDHRIERNVAGSVGDGPVMAGNARGCVWTTFALGEMCAPFAGLVQVGSPGQDPVPTFVAGGAEPGNTLIIYRPSEIGFIPNVGTAPEVTLNGESVSTCRVGSPLVLRVPDGNWRVGARSGTQTSDQTIEGNVDRHRLLGDVVIDT